MWFFFSFILENLKLGIENEQESEGRLIQQYMNDNECIHSTLDEISINGENEYCSSLALTILDLISPD